jgi:broad specificity phosphatase PhoE
MSILYLVRHGENRANLTKEFSHRKIDYPLTIKGRLQAEQTAHFLKDKHINKVYASPLLRAVETAEMIARIAQTQVEIHENFRELDAGCLEDLPPTEENWQIYINVLKDWMHGRLESSFPGGENFLVASQRARAAINEVMPPNSQHNVVVVGHGGIFFVAITQICQGVNFKTIFDQDNHNCSITTIESGWQEGEFSGRLLSWADHSHLHGDAADLVSGLPDFP